MSRRMVSMATLRIFSLVELFERILYAPLQLGTFGCSGFLKPMVLFGRVKMVLDFLYVYEIGSKFILGNFWHLPILINICQKHFFEN